MAKMQWKADEYYAGGGEWDVEKSQQLAELAKLDPTMEQQISSYVNTMQTRMGSSRVAGAMFNPAEKDLYTLAQDMYLRKMASTLRGAHQASRGI